MKGYLAFMWSECTLPYLFSKPNFDWHDGVSTFLTSARKPVIHTLTLMEMGQGINEYETKQRSLNSGA